ncbi:MAG: hypothetical protein PQJ46_11070 [Spirochaetales bacterium]|nr:hypothetical protein [Spirochaetales bacterium]
MLENLLEEVIKQSDYLDLSEEELFGIYKLLKEEKIENSDRN